MTRRAAMRSQKSEIHSSRCAVAAIVGVPVPAAAKDVSPPSSSNPPANGSKCPQEDWTMSWPSSTFCSSPESGEGMARRSVKIRRDAFISEMPARRAAFDTGSSA